MIKKRDKVYLQHMRDAVRAIAEFVQGVDKAEFNKNSLISSAVIRQLEIIGEAAKNLSSEFKKEYPEIEWRKISGLRDILIHEYIRVDLGIVWNIVKYRLADLDKFLDRVLK